MANSTRIFKPALMASIALSLPVGALICIALIPWVQKDPFGEAVKLSLMWLGLAALYVLALTPMYSARLVFDDEKMVSKTWYAQRAVLYAEIEAIELFVHGPYGSLALRLKGKSATLPWVLLLGRFEKRDVPAIVAEVASRAPQAALNQRALDMAGQQA
jgi:hypothetical protein